MTVLLVSKLSARNASADRPSTPWVRNELARARRALRLLPDLAGLNVDGPHELLVLLCMRRIAGNPSEDIPREALADGSQRGKCLLEFRQALGYIAVPRDRVPSSVRERGAAQRIRGRGMDHPEQAIARPGQGRRWCRVGCRRGVPRCGHLLLAARTPRRQRRLGLKSSCLRQDAQHPRRPGRMRPSSLRSESQPSPVSRVRICDTVLFPRPVNWSASLR